MTVSVRGSGQMSTRSTVPLNASDPLPAGTRSGDLLVVAAIQHSTVTFGGDTELLDFFEFGGGATPKYSLSVARILTLPLDGEIHYSVGGLDPLTEVREGAIVWAILTPARPHATAWDQVWPEESSGSNEFDGFSFPPPDSPAILMATYTRQTVTNGSASSPAAFTPIERTTGSHSGVNLSLWTPPGPQPGTTVILENNAFAWAYFAYGLLATNAAPPCRVYPRDDRLASGSARVFPPPRTQQGGRLNGPY